MIGNSNNCNCCSCCFNQAENKLYNVGGATSVRVVSWSDDNRVWVNDEAGDLGLIQKNQVLEIPLSVGDVLYSCKPVFASGERGASNRALMPDYLASNVLGTTASRYGGIEINIYSLTATSADIFRNGVLVNTIALTPDTVDTFLQTNSYTGNWKVVANGLILGYKGEDAPFNGDTSAMMKPYNDLLGWASSSAYVAKENASATPTPFQVYSHLGDYTTGTIETTYNVVNNTDLPHNGSQSFYYDPRGNIRVQSLENLYGNSRADNDGGDDTPLMPIDLLRTHHKIPQPSEFIALSSLNAATIDVFDGNGVLVTTLTTTKVNANPLAPYAVRYGTPNGATNIPLGYEFVGSEPIAVVYQPKGAGVFGSDDDETVSFGYNL